MYYKVLVASARYHKDETLTYSYDQELSPGTIVSLQLQSQTVVGIVVSATNKPSFKVKPVMGVISYGALSGYHMMLIDWIKQYYPSPGGLIHGLFAPTYLMGKISSELLETRLQKRAKQPTLTPEQKHVLQQIVNSQGHSVLLHGITGSGKTRVYIELALGAINKGKSVIVLTPEIGLTPQLTESFVSSCDNVVVLHSTMTPKERRQAWHSIVSRTVPQVIIGPRSALFAPVKNLGLIVVDEMHDQAYKQEQSPHYLTTRVAAKLAELSGSRLVLGSATPPVTDYHVFQNNNLPIVEMSSLATGNKKQTDTVLVNLHDRAQFTHSNWLSQPLLESIESALAQKSQSLLFLNRRGTARVILCNVCGWQALCPRCDLPLTYHGDTHQATCHTCGYSQKAPNNCAACHSTDILFKSAGTKTIVSELERLYPKAIVRRFDSDLKKGERLQNQYDSLTKGGVDILVGTQMLGKGLDLPNLAVVGVILADTTLNFPDYTAEERTFQMLNQVIGRVGRGHRPASVIIQTHNPDSAVIKQAIEGDYREFYATEIKQREKYGFPPFYFVLKLTCSRKSLEGARKSAQQLVDKLQKVKLPLEVVGPSPSFIEKSHTNYNWQIIVKARKRSDLLRIIGLIPANWQYDLDPVHLL